MNKLELLDFLSRLDKTWKEQPMMFDYIEEVKELRF